MWVAVACVAAIVIEVGAATDGFGLAGLFPSSGGSSSSPPASNPNPYGERVMAVYASITGSNASSFPALEGTNLCLYPSCPLLPRDDTTYDPPVAGVWFYFNVTNTGSSVTSVANFTLATSGSNPHLFELMAVKCCYSPHGPSNYGEVVTAVSFTPSPGAGSAYGLAAYAIAPSIPDDGITGYTLYFNSTSP